METKLCRKCGETKPYTEFTKTTYTKSGITSNCRLCRNAYSRQRRADNYDKVRETEKASHYKHRLMYMYGISREDYNKMHNEQAGCCAICGVHQDTLKKSLVVDHCHTTGVVRKLLCGKCNIGLGCFDDNINFLSTAIKYLKGKYDMA